MEIKNIKYLILPNFRYNSIVLLFLIILVKSLNNNMFIYIDVKIINIFISLFIFICIIYFKNYLYFYKNSTLCLIFILFRLIFRLILFFTKNLIYFFILFELSIIPIFFYIIFFRLTEKKIISSLYLLIYTSLFSIIFLTFLIIELKFMKTNSIFFLIFIFSRNLNFFKIFILIIFLVKIPIFFFHIWLPKAHVESSSFGSIILAGILLKLGRLGIIVFTNFITSFNFNILFILFLIISRIYILILCFILNDLKTIFAYFSVTHIMLFIISLTIINLFSLKFCFIIIISHSISSRIIFFFFIILYKNYSSRILNKLRRIFSSNNLFSWTLYLLLLINISIPPTFNFFREILILFLSLKYSFKLFLLFSIFIRISGVISIIIVIKTIISKEIIVNFYFKFINLGDYLIFLILFIFHFLIVLKIDLFSRII